MIFTPLSRVPADHVAVIEHLGRPVRVVAAGERVGGLPLLDRVGRLFSTRTHRLVLRDAPLVSSDGYVMLATARVDYRIVDAMAFVTSVIDHQDAVTQLAIDTLRRVAGTMDSDDVLMASGAMGETLRTTVAETIARWGLEVTSAEVEMARHRDGYSPVSTTELLDY